MGRRPVHVPYPGWPLAGTTRDATIPGLGLRRDASTHGTRPSSIIAERERRTVLPVPHAHFAPCSVPSALGEATPRDPSLVVPVVLPERRIPLGRVGVSVISLH